MRRLVRHRRTRAALLLIAFLGVFFSTPLQGGYYAPVDILQGYPLYGIAPAGYHVKSGQMGDPTFQMLPFMVWDRSQLLQWQLPLWNPLNASGAPQLANYISAVFSPFNVLVYLLDFRWGLLASAFAKLFVTGFFTYLFLELLGLDFWACIVGALGFMFSGYNIVWLNWPQVAAGVGLPAAMFFAELAFRSEGRDWSRQVLALVGVTCSLAVGLLGGHPETFYFGAALFGAFVLYRLVSMRSPKKAIVLAIEFAGALILSLGLASIQLLPFGEYLLNSEMFAERSGGSVPGVLSATLLPLQFFPNLLGNPSTPYASATVNFQEDMGNYLGLVILFLAGISVATWFRYRSSYVVFFTGASVFWLVYAYNIAGLGPVLNRIPLFSFGAVTRSDVIFLFSMSCLAAFGLHMVRRLSISSAALGQLGWPGQGRLAVGLVGASVVVALAALSSIKLLVDLSSSGTALQLTLPTPLPPDALVLHLLFIVSTFALAVIGLVWVVTGRGLWRLSGQTFGGVLVGTAVFLQTGFLFKDHNPTIEDRYFYRPSAALQQVEQILGQDQSLVLPPSPQYGNVNMAFGFRTATSNDAMFVKNYATLYGRFFRSTFPYDAPAVDPMGTRALQVMGVSKIVSFDPPPWGPYPFAHRIGPTPPDVPGGGTREQLLLGESVKQNLRVNGQDFNLLAIPLANPGGANTCTVAVTLTEATTGASIAGASYPCSDIGADDLKLLEFAPQTDAIRHTYVLTLTTQGGAGGSIVTYTLPVTGDQPSVMSDGTVLPRQLAVDAYVSPVAGLSRVWRQFPFDVFAVPGVPARYRTVGQSILSSSDEHTMDLLSSPQFDLNGTIVLAASGQDYTLQGVDSGAGAVTVEQERPSYVKLGVDRDSPGWLMALQTYFPGWTATVNGQSVALSRADVAFTAVPIGAGHSEIVLQYQPESVRVGALLSGLAILLTVGIVAACLLATNRAGRAPVP